MKLKRKLVMSTAVLTGLTLATGFAPPPDNTQIAVAVTEITRPVRLEAENMHLVAQPIQTLRTAVDTPEAMEAKKQQAFADSVMTLTPPIGEKIAVMEIFMTDGGRAPALLLPNGDPAVLAGETGEGWWLEKGQTLTLDVCVTAADPGYTIGVIAAGRMQAPEDYATPTAHYVFKAPADGFYDLYIQNGTSDYLAVTEGVVGIKE